MRNFQNISIEPSKSRKDQFNIIKKNDASPSGIIQNLENNERNFYDTSVFEIFIKDEEYKLIIFRRNHDFEHQKLIEGALKVIDSTMHGPNRKMTHDEIVSAIVSNSSLSQFGDEVLS